MYLSDVVLYEKQLVDEFLWLTENQPRWKYRSLALLNRVRTYSPDQSSYTINRITYGIFNRGGELIRTISCPNRKPLGSSYRKAGVSPAARLFRC